MTKKKKISEPEMEKADTMNEPAFPYHTIRKSSFEALEEENRLYSLKLSPSQRFAYLLELNINAFGRESLLIKDFGNEIKQK